MPRRQRIFVYGTLKQGYSNAHLLDVPQKVAMIGTAETVNKDFALLDLGPYPCLVRETEPPAVIKGEVYDVTAMVFKRLDRLEGYPHLYDRVRVNVKLSNGKQTRAWVYFMKRPKAELTRRGAREITNGEWVPARLPDTFRNRGLFG